jgi:medium-chain acyl-[acyl-carrier-protein] hydrolase
MREDLAKLGFPVRTDGALDFDAEKIQPQTEVVTLAQFQVRNSDIDMNQHVNNTRYAQWVLDAIPFSSHSRFNLKEYEVNFIAETKAGDVITIQEARANADVSNGQVFFQGFREADSKVTFTVRMRIENR